MNADPIDVHTHLVPPFWARDLPQHGGNPFGWGAPEWSSEQLLGFVDEDEIAGQHALADRARDRGLAWRRPDRHRAPGERLRRRTRQPPPQPVRLSRHPGPAWRRRGLGGDPLCYEELGVDGVCLHSNFDQICLGDDRFLPIWEELDRRSAVVFVHPTTPEAAVLAGIPGPIEDYPADTTRAALQLVVAGHMTRFANIKIILSHGGGFLPYAASRFAELTASLHPDRSAESLIGRARPAPGTSVLRARRLQLTQSEGARRLHDDLKRRPGGAGGLRRAEGEARRTRRRPRDGRQRWRAGAAAGEIGQTFGGRKFGTRRGHQEDLGDQRLRRGLRRGPRGPRPLHRPRLPPDRRL